MSTVGRLTAPIFVVGAPRSGTTLLASMLAGHPRIACGPETQFFNKLSPARLGAAVKDPAWPDRAVKLVTSLTLAHQPVIELFGHSEGDVRQFLESQTPSVGAILESLTALYAAKQGKPRWAEKTPNHLLHLPTLRQTYPDAPIVRIVRDPRDSALSMRKLPWASRSALANGYLWTAWFEQSQPFFGRDAHTLTLRYEDLVTAPETVLTRLCSFVGETFRPGMLETKKTGGGVSSPNERWKALNTRALDASRTQVWRRETPDLQRALSCVCASGIEAFGYPDPVEASATLSAYPLNLRTVEAHEETLSNLLLRGVKPLEPERLPRELELLFLPSLPKGKRLLSELVKLSQLLLTRRFKGQTTYYLPPRSKGGRFLSALCRTVATPYAPATGAKPNLQPTSPGQPAAPSVLRLRSLQRTRYWVGRARGRPNPRGQARD